MINNENKSENKGAITTFNVLKKTKCKKNVGFGVKAWRLFDGLDYDATDLKIGEEEVTFSLYDELGWIGDYSVSRIDFENNCLIVK